MDSLRMAIAPATPESGGGFQVLIFVNDVEMTAAGAGLGMDPYDVLIPTNRFEPTAEPRTFGVARCGCGVYGCGATDISVTKSSGAVTWTWSAEVPINRAVSFDEVEYLNEIHRVANDHSWEVPERTAGRLVLTGADRQHLERHGLTIGWVENDVRAPDVFKVSLSYQDAYQIFLRFPWAANTPQALADRVLDTLNDARGPSSWVATWHGVSAGNRYEPPRIAQPSWSRESL